jgi:hypothetical protein
MKKTKLPIRELVLDSMQTLEANDLAKRAIDVATGAIDDTEADKAWEFPDSVDGQKLALAKYKATIAALNAANGIVKTKVSILKLSGLDEKLKAIKKHAKRL